MDIPMVSDVDHTRSVTDLSYAYGYGGVLLLTASEDHTAILRNGETGGFIHKFVGHEGQVWSCDINPVAEVALAATASEDSTVRIWNMNARGCVHQFSEGNRNIMQSCAFSLNGEQILMGGFGGLKSYGLTQPNTPTWEAQDLDAVVRCVAWIDKNRLAVSFSDKLGISIYDVRDPSKTRHIWTDSSVTSIELDKDKKYFTAVYGDNAAIWNVQSLGKVADIPMPCLLESASFIFRHPSHLLVAGGDNGLIYKTNFTDQTNFIDAEFNMGCIQCVRYSPDGESYAVGFRDGSTIIRKYHTDEQMEEPEH